jgi:hypothetical protein
MNTAKSHAVKQVRFAPRWRTLALVPWVALSPTALFSSQSHAAWATAYAAVNSVAVDTHLVLACAPRQYLRFAVSWQLHDFCRFFWQNEFRPAPLLLSAKLADRKATAIWDSLGNNYDLYNNSPIPDRLAFCQTATLPECS